MKITYIGHSCFKLQDRGYSVVIDPYTDGYVPGLADVREEANLMLSSHDHKDHTSEGTVKIVESEYEPFKIRRIVTPHDHEGGRKRGTNIVHIIESKNAKVAHLGDLGDYPAPEVMEALQDLDVLMIPVGGKYTIGPAEAIELTNAIGARMTVPMHYYSKEGECGLEDLDTVYSYAAFMHNVMMKSNSMLDTNDLYKNSVIVLQPQNQIKDLTKLRVR